MDWPLFNICLLTLVIHLIGALAYAARIAGVRTHKIALSFALFNVLFSLPLAWIADRYSRVKLISVCLALWSAMTALSGAAPVLKSSEHHFFRLSDPRCKSFLKGWLEEREGEIVPYVQGRAFITAKSTLYFDPEDPFRAGLG